MRREPLQAHPEQEDSLTRTEFVKLMVVIAMVTLLLAGLWSVGQAFYRNPVAFGFVLASFWLGWLILPEKRTR